MRTLRLFVVVDDRAGSLPAIPVDVSRRPDASGPFAWIVAEVPLAPLAPGDYGWCRERRAESLLRTAGHREVPVTPARAPHVSADAQRRGS